MGGKLAPGDTVRGAISSSGRLVIRDVKTLRAEGHFGLGGEEQDCRRRGGGILKEAL